MQNDYARVSKALEEGAEPSMLCATCPWDRLCVQPPEMDRTDIERQREEAKVRDDEEARKAELKGEKPGMPVGSLLTILMNAGKDQQGYQCPVFALRLRSSDGRAISDGLKQTMAGLS